MVAQSHQEALAEARQAREEASRNVTVAAYVPPGANGDAPKAERAFSNAHTGRRETLRKALETVHRFVTATDLRKQFPDLKHPNAGSDLADMAKRGQIQRVAISPGRHLYAVHGVRAHGAQERAAVKAYVTQDVLLAAIRDAGRPVTVYDLKVMHPEWAARADLGGALSAMAAQKKIIQERFKGPYPSRASGRIRFTYRLPKNAPNGSAAAGPAPPRKISRSGEMSIASIPDVRNLPAARSEPQVSRGSVERFQRTDEEFLADMFSIVLKEVGPLGLRRFLDILEREYGASAPR